MILFRIPQSCIPWNWASFTSLRKSHIMKKIGVFSGPKRGYFATTNYINGEENRSHGQKASSIGGWFHLGSLKDIETEQVLLHFEICAIMIMKNIGVFLGSVETEQVLLRSSYPAEVFFWALSRIPEHNKYFELRRLAMTLAVLFWVLFSLGTASQMNLAQKQDSKSTHDCVSRRGCWA